jgi:hypothetical protein
MAVGQAASFIWPHTLAQVGAHRGPAGATTVTDLDRAQVQAAARAIVRASAAKPRVHLCMARNADWPMHVGEDGGR